MKTIQVPALARVEGEGGLLVRLEGDQVAELKLNIYEPPRFFEGFLRGRHFQEIPDITARICGICPVAYQMSSVLALEKALGVTVTEEISALRRLFYAAEYIESHALHMFMLQAPDLLGQESALSVAAENPELVKTALRLKKIGNALLKGIGGRSVHPVNACVGGFYRWPKAEVLRALEPDLAWGLEASSEAFLWAAGLDFPDYEDDYEWVALHDETRYATMEGAVRSSVQGDLEVDDFQKDYVEFQVPHSTALHSRRRDGGPDLVGPLARFNLNFSQLRPEAARLMERTGLRPPIRNPYKAFLARGLELVQAYAEALDLVRTFRPSGPSRVSVAPRAGEGAAATEAPRGLLFHRYRLNDQGMIETARIVPPTAQNLSRIEADLRGLLPSISDRPDGDISLACEALVRAYDPCISCSTHFLSLKLERT
jgi:sulfhydrogenase subunit alpha